MSDVSVASGDDGYEVEDNAAAVEQDEVHGAGEALAGRRARTTRKRQNVGEACPQCMYIVGSSNGPNTDPTQCVNGCLEGNPAAENLISRFQGAIAVLDGRHSVLVRNLFTGFPKPGLYGFSVPQEKNADDADDEDDDGGQGLFANRGYMDSDGESYAPSLGEGGEGDELMADDEDEDGPVDDLGGGAVGGEEGGSRRRQRRRAAAAAAGAFGDIDAGDDEDEGGDFVAGDEDDDDDAEVSDLMASGSDEGEDADTEGGPKLSKKERKAKRKAEKAAKKAAKEARRAAKRKPGATGDVGEGAAAGEGESEGATAGAGDGAAAAGAADLDADEVVDDTKAEPVAADVEGELLAELDE